VARRALPPLKQPRWTLLVQALDQHLDGARALLERFRFVPDARLDDLMLSFATDGGGVGPHLDSYDVFLLQLSGRRRWRIGPPGPSDLVPDVPLKILANFQPDREWVLEPGDLLYLPPGWAHDGVALGECMTASVGFRAAARLEIGRDVLQRLVDAAEQDAAGPLYRDPMQAATDAPGRIPPRLQAFAARAVARLLREPHALECALGEVLSEPKRGVWFDPGVPRAAAKYADLVLDARTRMIYDARHIFINGESFRAAGRDAALMRALADRRMLPAAQWRVLSPAARDVVEGWLEAGWAARRAVDEG
jgi:50S ribosomal protein L16 3-hydroxylase